MELEYVKCRPEHFAYINVQDAQKEELAQVIHTDYADLMCQNLSLSVWLNSRCLGAAGIVPVYPHRAIAWALVSRDIGAALVPISRKVRRILELDPTPRIEMTVAVDFKAGHTWAGLLGMTLETPEPLRRHGARGEDEMLYARIK